MAQYIGRIILPPSPKSATGDIAVEAIVHMRVSESKFVFFANRLCYATKTVAEMMRAVMQKSHDKPPSAARNTRVRYITAYAKEGQRVPSKSIETTQPPISVCAV